MSTPKPKNLTKITINIVKNVVAEKPTDELSLMRANRTASRKFRDRKSVV